MVNHLPRITHKGKEYFVDLRLGEIRNTEVPWDSISFDRITDSELFDKVEAVQFENLTKNILGI